ncbi:MAG: TraR/DksA family transcriptional regulator [Acidimicrobiales bacterium]
MVETDRYRRLLEAHLVQVEQELAERRAAGGAGDARPGFGKRAGDYVAQVVEDRTNNQLADNLELTADTIRTALLSIDEGRFGSCAACGCPIEADRLEAVPWAPLCIACQSAAAARRSRCAAARNGDGAEFQCAATVTGTDQAMSADDRPMWMT